MPMTLLVLGGQKSRMQNHVFDVAAVSFELARQKGENRCWD